MTDGQKKTIIIDGDVHPSALALLEARPDIELMRYRWKTMRHYPQQ